MRLPARPTLVLIPSVVLSGHLLQQALQLWDSTVSHVVPSTGTQSRERARARHGVTIRHQTLNAGVGASSKPAPSPRHGVAGDTPGGLGVSGVPNLFSPKGVPGPLAHLGASEGK